MDLILCSGPRFESLFHGVCAHMCIFFLYINVTDVEFLEIIEYLENREDKKREKYSTLNLPVRDNHY